MKTRTLILSAVAALGMASSALAQQWVNPNYCAAPPCQTGCTVVQLQPTCTQQVVYTQPVYVQPVVVQQPVYYVQQQPVYYVQPAPVYYAPPPVYCPPPSYNYCPPRYYGGGCGYWSGSHLSISIGGFWGGGHHGRWSGGFRFRGCR